LEIHNGSLIKVETTPVPVRPVTCKELHIHRQTHRSHYIKRHLWDGYEKSIPFLCHFSIAQILDPVESRPIPFITCTYPCKGSPMLTNTTSKLLLNLIQPIFWLIEIFFKNILNNFCCCQTRHIQLNVGKYFSTILSCSGSFQIAATVQRCS